MFLFSLLVSPASGAEGMWLPEQVPALADRLRADGVTADIEALSRFDGAITGAVVSLGGCTASLVSSSGLVVTNHHCAYRTVQHHSTPERDLLKTGFLAESRAEELRAVPGSYIYVTTAVRDVTSEVMTGIPRKISDAELARHVERKERALVDACEAVPATRCRVVRPFSASRFVLVTQLEIRDVRLVYAPALGVGNFGGEVDNWMWPRHTGDFTFLRAYVGKNGQPADYAEDNVPYQPAKWLTVSTDPVQEGDPILVLGYPARTSRYETADELAFARDLSLPESIRYAEQLIGILEAQSARSPEAAHANYPRIRGLANAMKKRSGVLQSLADGRVEAARRLREAEIGSYIAADRKRSAEGNPVSQIAVLLDQDAATVKRDRVLGWLSQASPMLGEAIALWRMAEERAKPDIEREEGYRARDESRFLQARKRSQDTIDPESDRATLRFLLAEADALPADQRVAPIDSALLATGKTSSAERIEALLDKLYAGTKMNDLAAREALTKSTTEQLAALDDSMMALVKALSPVFAEQRERGKSREGKMLKIGPRYSAALAATSGGALLYPDADATLRLTWGKVAPLSPRDAVSYASRTSLRGILEKATGEPPFDAPDALIAAAQRPAQEYVDASLGTVPVDFLSTCDITGGNSGSPTLDGKGRLNGLAFDGNLEGVASDLGFNAEVTRTIHVDAAYMRWVMDEVDGADHLLEEMGLPHTDGPKSAGASGSTVTPGP